MKNATFLFFSATFLFFFFLSITGYGQTYNVSVSNGYGGGTFNVGDTVHVWAREMSNTEVFDKWAGDAGFLEAPDEWHSFFAMPAQDVFLDAQFNSVGTYDTEYIQCVQSEKKVHHYFPADPDGLVFLFHGSSGMMDNWVQIPGMFQMFRDLMADNFAVVVTEAEEVTIDMDIDMDGKKRWLTNYLSIAENIDVQNIQALIDTFENRGLISPSVKKYAVGMSNGGRFSSTVSYLLSFDGAVPYCVKANPTVIANTEVPTFWCMEEFDDNPNVGPAAYYIVLNWSNGLVSDNVCSGVYLNRRSPIYPQIFARSPAISLSQSQLIFNELNDSGFLDNINGYYYTNLYADSIFFGLVAPSPSTYPVLATVLSNFNLLLSVGSQMDVARAGHKFFSSHNKRTIAFLRDPCSFVTPVAGPPSPPRALSVYPNPAGNAINVLPGSLGVGKHCYIYALNGKLAKEFDMGPEGTAIDISGLGRGLYILKTDNEAVKFIVE